MRILILSQWFDPEPTIKGLPFARALAQAGHEVRVITGFPNYPGGKVYGGYRIRPFLRETVDGIVIDRVPLYPSHDGSALGRILNYLSFAVSATVAGLFIGFKPDVMYVYHPPLTVGIAAAVIGFLRRIPFVYDIQDLWPDSLAATGMIASENVLDVVAGVANRVYRRAAVVVAQSPGFVARLIERGVPPAKLRLIYNWCDEDALATRADDPGFDPRLLEGRFNVVFAGNMGKAQGLRAVVAAAGIVEKQDERVQFLFVGEGTDLNALKAYASELALRNVRFIPRLAMTQVGHLLNAADALLVHLQHCPLFAITVPSKTQAYLYAGKPIVMAVEGDAAALVAEASAGVCARPEDPDSIAGAIMTLVRLSPEERTAMGSRGRKFYDASLSLKAGTSQMIRAFREAAREPAIT